MAAMESQVNGNGSYPVEETTAVTRIHRGRGGWITFPFVAVSHTGLSLASAGWMGNLIVYLIKQFNIKSIDATQVINVVNGCISLFAVAGAIIADSFFGNFFVSTISAFTSFLGVILFLLTGILDSLRPPHCENNSSPSGECERPSRIQFTVLYMAIALASVGVGGTRFTIAAIGADQFDKPEEQGVFFNWYIFCLYFATTIGLTVIVYVQDNVSWGLGFGLCLVAHTIGLVMFLVGKKYYRDVKPRGSPFTGLARVVVAAIRKRKMLHSSESKAYYYDRDEDNTLHPAPTSSFRFFNRAALKTQNSTHQDGYTAKSWKQCTVQEVEDLKTLIRIIPLWTSNIFLSISIGMMYSLAVLQALTMNRHVGPHFQVPSGSFLVFTYLTTTIFLVLLDRFLLPIFQKLINTTPTLLQRVGIGHVMNILAMISAALIESRRLHIARRSYHHHHPNVVAASPGSSNSFNHIVSMSALWLVLPLGLVGIGEAFHFPGQVTLYYQEFPVSLRSTSTATISLLIALGYYSSTAIVDLVRKVTNWLPDDINRGRLDNVYWMLAVIGFINFGYYLICSTLYKYQSVEESKEDSRFVNESI